MGELEEVLADHATSNPNERDTSEKRPELTPVSSKLSGNDVESPKGHTNDCSGPLQTSKISKKTNGHQNDIGTSSESSNVPSSSIKSPSTTANSKLNLGGIELARSAWNEPSDISGAPTTDNQDPVVVESGDDKVFIVDEDPVVIAEWKTITTDESLPLLDLAKCWSDIANSSDEENAEKSSKVLCDELKHYFWNQVILDNPNLKLTKTKMGKDLFNASLEDRIAYSKEMDSGKASDDEEADSENNKNENSVFSEAIIFKLRCHDKNLKKETPKMSPEEDIQFLRNIHTQLLRLQKSSLHFSAIASTWAMEMTVFLLAKLLEGKELHIDDMFKISKDILFLLAENANPKEMHLMIKSFVNKVSTTHYEGTAFFMLCELMEIWGKVIVRIKRKRALFLCDVLKIHETMLPCAEAHRNCHGLYDESEDAGGLTNRLPTILIKMFSSLLDSQENQWKCNPEMQAVIDVNGYVYQSRVVCCKRTSTNASYHERNTSQLFDGKVNTEPAKSDSDAIIDDWLLERQIMLSFILDVVKDVMFRLQVPEKGDSKEVKTRLDEYMIRLYNVREIFNRLGWASPLRALQLSSLYLYMKELSENDEILRQGLGPVVRFSANTKYITYSTVAVSCYLFLALRKPGKSSKSLFDLTLQGSGFEFLDPNRAFNVALTFIMSLTSLTSNAIALAGVHIANLFLDRIDRKWTDDEILQWEGSLSASGRDVAIDGLCLHLGRLVERIDEPNNRELVYKTLQKIIRKINSPQLRFSVIHSLSLETDRIPVAAQLITELKDVLAYGDELLLLGDNSNWSVEQNDQLRSRYVECLFPKYFLPRKDTLSAISPIIALSMGSLFIAIRDRKSSQELNTSTAMPGIETRKKFMREHMSVAKEVLRALCSCSEHDMKRIPEKQLKLSSEKRQLHEAASRTLNQCLSVISTMDRALSVLNGEQ